VGMIDYRRFDRVLARCEEVAAEPEIDGSVKRVFEGRLKAPAAGFRAAHQKVTATESSFAKENAEALAALSGLDQPFRGARGEVLAVVPTTVLPETLKAQPTDTDRLTAIEGLLDVLDDNAGEDWSKALLSGPFGVGAQQAVKEITEAIAANKQLAAARTERATAYGPAYEAYLAFKRVVREALGPSSKQYQRIHIRGNGTVADEGSVTPEPAPAKVSQG